MIHMAAQPEGAVVSKAQLAEAAEVPESFLSKILQSLSRAGLVQIRRGVLGGNSLSSRGQQATILDTIEAVDGPIALNVCLNGSLCNRQPRCSAHNMWVRAQEAMLAVLAQARIAELALEKPGHSLLSVPHGAAGEETPAASGELIAVRTRNAPRGSLRTVKRNQITKG